MPEDSPQDQISFLLSDFNARLRDTEEKNRVIKERIVILGNNVIMLKDNLENSISELKKEISILKKEKDNIKGILDFFVNESNSFVRKDEIALIERMLKDFYPLDFARSKDMGEIINENTEKLRKDFKIEIDQLSKIVNKEQSIKEIRRIEEKFEKNLIDTEEKIMKEIRRIEEENRKEFERIAGVKEKTEKSKIEHKILSSPLIIKNEEHKKLNEHINNVMQHLNQKDNSNKSKNTGEIKKK